MAARRGYRPPRDYDPRRGKKGGNRVGKDASKKKATEYRSFRGAEDDILSPFSDSDSRGAPAAPLTAPLPAPLEATRTAPEDVAGTTFSELGLGGNIVRALAELGASEPFAVQAATIPDAIAGHHLLARARTGSGKTIAFGAALVERLLRLKAEGAFPPDAPRVRVQRGERQARPERGAARAPKALILAPTRELALQIDRTVQPIARSVGFYTGQFVGGQPFEPQLHALKRGVDIVIGTPGRVEDLAKRGHLNLGQIAVTVLDEADHMADLGFIEPVRRILRQTRRGGQRMLFSATLDTAVSELVREFMPRPATHEIVAQGGERGAVPGARGGSSGVGPGAGSSADAGGADAGGIAGDEAFDWRPQPNVEHRVLIVLREHKDHAIRQLVREGGRTLVFSRTRAYAERVTEMLEEAGVPALSLHGDLSQARRERNLERFAEGRVNVLVATDVAARGIHIDDVDLVLQADPPDEPKAYVHRAGRTGRVGRAGRVLTLIPRTRQQRTRELFAALGFEPAFFGDFVPEGAPEIAPRQSQGRR